jgi:hypothetical protein
MQGEIERAALPARYRAKVGGNPFVGAAPLEVIFDHHG